jgi:hypothetical protein
MNNKLIPIAVVLATAALLAMTAATPFAYAEGYGKSGGGDQRSETNEELKSEADCNFSGKGNTCLQIPLNIEVVADAGI